MSEAKVALGRSLFYDADLSLDGSTSCGTCYEQHRAFTEGNASHPGVGGVPGRRNVMALGNAAYFTPLTWADPGQHTLELQMLVPLQGSHPIEMGMAGKDAELARRLSADSCHQQMFAAAFLETKGRIDLTAIGKALASFERTLIRRALRPLPAWRSNGAVRRGPTWKEVVRITSLRQLSCRRQSHRSQIPQYRAL